MRNRRRPSIVHVYARVCTYKARVHGRGRTDEAIPAVTQCDRKKDSPQRAAITAAPYWHDAASALYVGDARAVLAGMPDGSADCIVTSPPYWGKRDYGVAGQYGHESDPAAYVGTLRAVFAEARRVLADDGTCWLNLGDSYSAGGGTATGLHIYLGPHLAGHTAPGIPAKNLLGLPWRVAFALQDDGWILRNAIVWHKPNAMPESVKDRLNCRHEMIFLLVKQPAYWFDLDPIRIPHATGSQRQSGMPVSRRRPGSGSRLDSSRQDQARPGGTRPPKYGPHTREVTGARRYGISRSRRAHPNGRNPGDVWSIPTRPYRGPHFAAFPAELPARCIKAGCKPGGLVLDPFNGTGTTGLAALALGRRFTGIELNPAFAALAAERLRHAAARQPDGSEDGQQ
jgi:DNA modification methylase